MKRLALWLGKTLIGLGRRFVEYAASKKPRQWWVA
jgi:hypothetical protein